MGGADAVDPKTALDRAVATEIPDLHALDAWGSLLHAQATLFRRLEIDLLDQTGLALADFDVLAQLALAGGQLRMTELAARALISRSGMTRRVARLVELGLVRRSAHDADARGIVVVLTDTGLARLLEVAPVHARGVRELFIDRLEDRERDALTRMLSKVTIDCDFG
jgi:DNA-binding MarR family transcriptional regulator